MRAFVIAAAGGAAVFAAALARKWIVTDLEKSLPIMLRAGNHRLRDELEAKLDEWKEND